MHQEQLAFIIQVNLDGCFPFIRREHTINDCFGSGSAVGGRDVSVGIEVGVGSISVSIAVGKISVGADDG